MTYRLATLSQPSFENQPATMLMIDDDRLHQIQAHLVALSNTELPFDIAALRRDGGSHIVEASATISFVDEIRQHLGEHTAVITALPEFDELLDFTAEAAKQAGFTVTLLRD